LHVIDSAADYLTGAHLGWMMWLVTGRAFRALARLRIRRWSGCGR
jgi:hypothetical protein